MFLEQLKKIRKNFSSFPKKKRIFVSANLGFTLIEILVVISIIAFISSIMMVQFVTARRAGRDSNRISNIVTLHKALDSYYIDNGYYPPAEQDYPGGFSPGAPWYYRVDDSSVNRFLPALKDSKITLSDAKDPLNKNYYYYQYTDAQNYSATPPANALDAATAMQGVCGPNNTLGVVIQFWLESSQQITTNPNFKLCANSPLTPPYYYCACFPNAAPVPGWPY